LWNNNSRDYIEIAERKSSGDSWIKLHC
jgi:hypothetical protein